MDHFLYSNGALHAEEVPVAEIAQAVGTPFYVYSTATLTRHYRLFEEALDGLDHMSPVTDPEQVNPLILKFADASLGVQHRARWAA